MRNGTLGIGANSFKYAPFDYRIEKTGTNGTLQYLLEGEHVEAVYKNAQVEAKYLRGAVIDEVVMGQEKNAANQLTAYNFHHDALQSLNAKTGSDGVLLQTVAYGAFGNTLLETDPNANATYVRYTGREQDRDTCPECGLDQGYGFVRFSESINQSCYGTCLFSTSG